MNGSKSWTQSSGVLGSLAAIVGILVNILNHFGVHFGLSQADLVNVVSDIITASGAVAAGLGRIYANTTIVSRKTAKQAANNPAKPDSSAQGGQQ